MAAGDRAGNVWVLAAGGRGGLLHRLEAHDAEVLCLEYAAQPPLLASASRDRLIHVFRVDKVRPASHLDPWSHVSDVW